MVFPNLFVNSTVYFVTDLELSRYICITHKNRDKHKPENKFVAGNKEDKELEGRKKPPGV